jgi:ParB-like chromosome segregation protein Spo0J
VAKNKGDSAVEEKAQNLEQLQVQYVELESLRPNDYNPNRQSDHDFELLLRSMREDGFTQPIVANREAAIVDGEHRWRAAQALGYTRVPVVFVDMSAEQMKVSILRHNRARGSEDVELAASVLRDLQQLGALDWAQDELMMDDTEVQRMVEDIPAPEALANEEFSQAWQPPEPEDKTNDETSSDQPTTTETQVRQRDDGGTEMTSATTEAIEAARERERQMALAKTAEEREMVQKEQQSFFRLMLMFQGEEADLVQRVLADRGAEKLVAILRDWEDRHPGEGANAAADAAGVEREEE